MCHSLSAQAIVLRMRAPQKYPISHLLGSKGTSCAKSSTFFSNNWGNVLSPYWAARAMAELGGYEYRGGSFGGKTWMKFLPAYVPTRSPRKGIFDEVCNSCTNYEFFNRGVCYAGWGGIAPAVLNNTRDAILKFSEEVRKEEKDAVFNFFAPADWLIYNRCCVFDHHAHAPGVLRTYDAIPAEGKFNVYIM